MYSLLFASKNAFPNRLPLAAKKQRKSVSEALTSCTF